MEKTIKILNDSNLPVIDFNDLEDFQKNLKSITPESLNKLKSSIIKHGICFPKAVWVHDNKYYTIDGHQTKKALQALTKDGYKIGKILYYKVNAKDISEAKKKLLLMNSQFGKITSTGLNDFFDNIESDMDEIMQEIELSVIDDNDILKEITGLSKKNKELKPIKKIHVLLSIPVDKFIDVQEVLENLKSKEFIEYEQSQN